MHDNPQVIKPLRLSPRILHESFSTAETLDKKTRLTALVQGDGTVLFNGQSYHSVSTVAGMARNSVSGPPQDGRPFYQTNGGTFWKYRDPATGALTVLDRLRQRSLTESTSQTKEGE